MLEPLEKAYIEANILPDEVIKEIQAKGKNATVQEIALLKQLLEEKENLTLTYEERHYAIIEEYGTKQEKEFRDKANKQRKLIEDYTKEYADITAKGTDKELSEFEKNKREKIKSLQDLLAKMKEAGLQGSQLWNDVTNSITSITNSKEKTGIFGLTETEIDKLKEKVDKIISAIQQVKGLWDDFSAMRNRIAENAIKKEEEQNEKSKQSLKSKLDKGIISQVNYDKKISAMDKAMDEKKKKLQHENAVREKAGRLFEIGLNIASGITANLKTPFMIPIVAAIGAIQFAIAAATPLPYARGGFIKNKTFAMMGEAGPEWVASNHLLTNPQTAPIIAGLQAMQEGKNVSIPNFSAMRQAAYSTRQTTSNITNQYITNTTDSGQRATDNGQLLNKIDKLMEAMQNPDNRRAYIVLDDLTQAQNSINSIRKFSKIK